MIRFTELSGSVQMLMLLFLFADALLLLILPLYKYSHREKLFRLIPDICMMALLLLLLAFLTLNHENSMTYPWIGTLPSAAVWLIIAAVLVYTVIGAVRVNSRRKTTLSLYAIKQTLDDLPSGICFTDATDRIVLVNHRMCELCATLTGSYPQTLSEITVALQSTEMKNGITRIDGQPALYRFPDGGVWCFRTTELSDMNGFTQTVAQNVTEVHNGNMRLQEDNEAMLCVNAKLREMYERLADRIREQETLNLRIKIHDSIGSSLIALSEMTRSGAEADTEKQLAVLKDAMSYFANDRQYADDGTFAAVQRQAAGMKVRLALNGMMPQNAESEALIIAAARECVTNCVHHARGDLVTVTVTEHRNMTAVTITNNGEVPKEKIIEGGGLSALRSSVEAYGGEMYISHKPAFALKINLPEKELE